VYSRGDPRYDATIMHAKWARIMAPLTLPSLIQDPESNPFSSSHRAGTFSVFSGQ
jgi:hypothetical protein